MQYRIMIVEDDEVIADAIASKLGKWAFDVRKIRDFKAVDHEFIEYDPQLVILDINLPFYDGHHWCEKIRKVSKVPVLYISSISDNMNIIMAMNMGGDDFISKPFDLDVLVAKVQALLRRAYDYRTDQSFIEVKGVILRLNDQTLLYNDQTVELTKNEYRILHTLFDRLNNVVTRDELMEKLWETSEFIDDNTLTVNMTRLRRKLEDVGILDLIETKKGQGYIVKDERLS